MPPSSLSRFHVQDKVAALKAGRQPHGAVPVGLQPPAVQLGEPDRAGTRDLQLQPALAEPQIGLDRPAVRIKARASTRAVDPRNGRRASAARRTD